MKALRGIGLALFAALMAQPGIAQVQPGMFSHIILIIQENRTPDNLFGATPGTCPPQTEIPFEPGADIMNGGPALQKNGAIQCLTSMPLTGSGFDPNHGYANGWFPQYDHGKMDGFCQSLSSTGSCLQYSFVRQSDVQPYYDIAKAYGFANYMFQTSEGASFAAHQFLFTGTSAPTAPGQQYSIDFIGGDPLTTSPNGCPAGNAPPTPPSFNTPSGSSAAKSYPECYTHDSLVTNAQGDKGISWRYYAPVIGSIWDAPETIPEVCYGANSLANLGQPCGGTEWDSHLSFYSGALGGAPIFSDIQNCQLQQISWVIPDWSWSDHPPNGVYGPSWVGDIIDAIGNSYQNSSGHCDYWGYGTGSTNPEPTAIFVVWDDWGGWFDHVLPPAVYRSPKSTTCPTSVQANGWGCGYVYGFRVPMLVISEYTPAGYVSGACTGNCPQAAFPYVHDFGSLLAFTEYDFGMAPIAPPYYADYNAPDASNGHIPLSDFFNLTNPRTFTYITTPVAPKYFEHYYSETHTTPQGPDSDDD